MHVMSAQHTRLALSKAATAEPKPVVQNTLAEHYSQSFWTKFKQSRGYGVDERTEEKAGGWVRALDQ